LGVAKQVSSSSPRGLVRGREGLTGRDGLVGRAAAARALATADAASIAIQYGSKFISTAQKSSASAR
jgi:hypothetical protein